MPTSSEPDEQPLRRLDSGVHALYVAQGRSGLDPVEGDSVGAEGIAAIEGVIPQLRGQLEDPRSGSDGGE